MLDGHSLTFAVVFFFFLKGEGRAFKIPPSTYRSQQMCRREAGVTRWGPL
jgi:hypothetical protein